MPTGLKIPVGVDASGGMSLVSGEENDAKIIKISLSDDDNENAFQQDIALGLSMIFDINDVTLKARVLRRVRAIFADFLKLKRFKLLTDTIKWSEDTSEQELTLEFRYLDLESDEERLYNRTFTAGEW
jgi:hypothetical protein